MQAMLLEHNSTLSRSFQHRMLGSGYNWLGMRCCRSGVVIAR
jgi:hypothetical protein